MTTQQQQPSLEAKKAYFEHFQTLPYSDDEGNDGETELAEQSLDPDGLDPRELRMRHRHRRFFQKKTLPTHKVSSIAAAAPYKESGMLAKKGTKDDDAVQSTTDDDGDDDDVVVVSSSARATPQDKATMNTRGGGKRNRNVVDDLLDEGNTEVIGETPVNMAKKQQRRGSTVKSATPIPLAKRLVAASAASKSTLSSSSSSFSRLGASAAAGTTTSAAKKRKKDGQVTLRPENEQIFRGLTFYYIPDNEIAPARRLRIQKAREYGATKTSDASQATHAIVDGDIGYKDAEIVLRLQRKEMGGKEEALDSVVVVNESYPIECVQFRALLDARQKRYRLNGQPVDDEEGDGEVTENEAAAEKVVTETTEKEGAAGKEEEQGGGGEERHGREGLKLKAPQRNPRKWDYVPRSTPKSSDESPGTPAEVESQPIALDGVTTNQDTSGERQPAESKGEKDTAGSDELTTFINMMQEFKDLPLDNDEEEETASTAGDGSPDSGSDAERENQQKQAAAKKKTTTSSYSKAAAAAAAPALADRFACTRSSGQSDHLSNPNSRTIEILSRMQSYYERISDQWRTMAYRKAISTLKRQPNRVTSHAEAVKLPGIGPRLAAKIEEIATTDRLARLEYAEQDDGVNVLKLFLGIYGVGPALAGQWMARGMKTLEDVRDGGVVKLTAAQKMGIEKYEDLNTKISRDEVEALGRVVKEMAKEVDEDAELTIGGSYRRGASQSSDIDFIVSKPGTESEAQLRPFLRELVRRLQGTKFLVATLAADGNIWHGCCVLPGGKQGGGGGGIWRRIDFLLVPASQMGAALIYFTGDDVFNRSLRLLAQKKGMKLNQRGLYKRPGGGRGGGSWGEMRNVDVTEEDLIEGREERRIFEILGVRWREPTQRWC